MKAMADKLRKWIIRRLGGYTREETECMVREEYDRQYVRRRAEAGIEIEVELADGTDAATITYPNIATFNAAARGEATDVNE